MMTAEKLEQQIRDLIDKGVYKDLKMRARLEIENIDERTLFNCDAIKEIVNAYPDFNSVVIRLRLGDTIEQALFINVDYLKEHVEAIPVIAKSVADMCSEYNREDDKA